MSFSHSPRLHSTSLLLERPKPRLCVLGSDLLAARVHPCRAGGSGRRPLFPGLRLGPPVWLPLARREEITAVPRSPKWCRVRAEPGCRCGRPSRLCRLSRSRLPLRRVCGARGPAVRPHAPCAAGRPASEQSRARRRRRRLDDERGQIRQAAITKNEQATGEPRGRTRTAPRCASRCPAARTWPRRGLAPTDHPDARIVPRRTR